MQDIDRIIKKKRLLLPILEEVQREYGFLPKRVLQYLSKKLNIPYSKIYGTATFYLQFEVRKAGTHIIKICNSPSCNINGSFNLLESIKKLLDLKTATTSSDRKFTLDITTCLGCCDKAPAVMIDGVVHGRMNERKLKNIIRKLRRKT